MLHLEEGRVNNRDPQCRINTLLVSCNKSIVTKFQLLNTQPIDNGAERLSIWPFLSTAFIPKKKVVPTDMGSGQSIENIGLQFLASGLSFCEKHMQKIT